MWDGAVEYRLILISNQHNESSSDLGTGFQTDPHRQDLLRGHDNIVTSVIFSQSGKLLASGQKASAYRDGEQIVVWDYDTRKPLYRLSGVDGTVKSLKFSEDDRFLSAIGEGNSNGNDIAIWDMQNGSVAQYVKCSRNCATCMCWGRTVVADPSRRVKTPKYSLFSFHSVQVRGVREEGWCIGDAAEGWAGVEALAGMVAG